LNVFQAWFSYAAQRIGSPSADSGKTRLRKTTFSTKWPPPFRAEGGQVEPVLGSEPVTQFKI